VKFQKKYYHRTAKGKVMKERRMNAIEEMKLQKKELHKITKGETMKEKFKGGGGGGGGDEKTS
jgi:hypothetical protein